MVHLVIFTDKIPDPSLSFGRRRRHPEFGANRASPWYGDDTAGSHTHAAAVSFDNSTIQQPAAGGSTVIGYSSTDSLDSNPGFDDQRARVSADIVIPYTVRIQSNPSIMNCWVPDWGNYFVIKKLKFLLNAILARNHKN
jgi:hypothetical protein